MTTCSILSVGRLKVCFGSRKVIQNLGFEVEAGDTLAIIGPNGAG
jgi:ABC-type branched-subunit amino acid transport system ATPase component